MNDSGAGSRESETTVLAGGYGAARFLRGLLRVVEPKNVAAVVNCGDDVVLNGLYISPDLDTITYCLAGELNPKTGWGLRGETHQALETLRRLGGETWFTLGDRDLGTHIYRTRRLAEGAPLSQVAAEIAAGWGVRIRLLPATDDRIETRLTLAAGRPDGEETQGAGDTEEEVGFQEYFVARSHSVEVRSIRFAGADSARPGPGVISAISQAARVVIAPSNPILSIWPILAIPGIRAVVEKRREATVAVSPIVADQALRGPAARLMAELGYEPSVAGVARLYAPLASVLVVDEADRHRRAEVEAEGMRCATARSVMHTPELAAELAEFVLSATP